MEGTFTRIRTRTNPTRRRRSAALRFIIDELDRRTYRAESLFELRQSLGAIVATDSLWESLDRLDMSLHSLATDPLPALGEETKQ